MDFRQTKFLTAAFTIFLAAMLGGCSTQMAESTPADAVVNAPLPSGDKEVDTALQFIERSPESATGYNQLAVLYMRRARQTGDFAFTTKAESAIDRALQAAPDDPAARKLKASLHLSFHRFREAAEVATQLLKEFPGDSFVYGVLTDAYMELGEYDRAVDAAQKMVDARPGTASYARVSQMRTLHGDHAGAVEAMTQAARSADPKESETQSWCLVQLGDEYWKNGDSDKASKVYDEALEVFPGYYLALASKGRLLAGRGDLDGAEKFLADAQNRLPSADAIINLGHVYTLRGDTEKAKQQYELLEVVEEKLGAAGDQKKLALFWANRGIKLPEALAIAENEYAVRKDIYTADVLAWCLYKNGRAPEAKKKIDEAMRLKTNDAQIKYHAGMIEKALGNNSGAGRLITEALKLNPAFDLIQAGAARKTLEEMKTNIKG
ncbi:MAG: tetratricopeptide repeat protein [Pyrinomonadaceae bacterium]